MIVTKRGADSLTFHAKFPTASESGRAWKNKKAWRGLRFLDFVGDAFLRIFSAAPYPERGSKAQQFAMESANSEEGNQHLI